MYSFDLSWSITEVGKLNDLLIEYTIYSPIDKAITPTAIPPNFPEKNKLVNSMEVLITFNFIPVIEFLLQKLNANFWWNSFL